MNPVECRHEADILSAVMQSRWPERTEPHLLEHAAHCAVCNDLVAVAGAIACESEQGRQSNDVPDSGRVWWVAQMRARREAATAAGRPITVVQVLAFSCAMGLLGACFGATSQWFQAVVRWFGTLPVPDLSATGILMLVLGVVALLIPFAVVYAIDRD